MSIESIIYTFFNGKELVSTDFQKILKSFIKVSFSKNEHILNEGDIANHFYFVEENDVVMTKKRPI